MKTVLSNARFWVIGTVVAFTGVALSILCRAELTGRSQVAGVFLGELLGLSGLLVICAGISRRVRRAERENSNP